MAPRDQRQHVGCKIAVGYGELSDESLIYLFKDDL